MTYLLSAMIRKQKKILLIFLKEKIILKIELIMIRNETINQKFYKGFNEFSVQQGVSSSCHSKVVFWKICLHSFVFL